MDNHMLNIYFGVLDDAKRRPILSKMVGNIPSLIDWQTRLHEFPTQVPQPLFYSEHLRLSFPLLFCSSVCIAKQTYKLRPNVGSLLRVQLREREGDDHSWKDVAFKETFVTGKTTLPQPELFARYGFVSQTERNYFLSKDEYSVYYGGVVMQDADNSSSFGKTVSMTVQTARSVKAAFFVAENMNASVRRNYSNYTTNPLEPDEGWNPISNVSLSYPDGTVYFNLPSDHFDRASHYYDFNGSPASAGYNAMSFTNDISSHTTDISAPFQGKVFKFDISNTDPSIIPIDTTTSYDDEPEDLIKKLSIEQQSGAVDGKHQTELQLFMIRLRLIVGQKYTFKKKTNEKDPTTFSYSFAII
jgi:hypothetical protein